MTQRLRQVRSDFGSAEAISYVLHRVVAEGKKVAGS